MKINEITQYRRLYEQLRKNILDGTYEKGEVLPSENNLCTINNVTRPTVRKALEMLASQGFIKKQQGLGSIVRELPKGIGILSASGTTYAMGNDKLDTIILEKPKVIKWPDNLVFELSEQELKSGCIYFDRIRKINDIPVFYEKTYIPNINLPRFTQHKLKNVSLFDVLRKKYQIRIDGGEQYIEAIMPSKILCNHLNVKSNQPILRLDRKLDTNRVNLYMYSTVYCSTKDYAIYGKF